MHRRFANLALLALLLTACVVIPTDTAIPTPTGTATLTLTNTATPTPTLTPTLTLTLTPTLTLTATPPPRKVGLVAPGAGAGDGSPAALVLAALHTFTAQYGWTVEQGDRPDAPALIAAGAQIVITVHTELPLGLLAAQNPGVQFVAVDEPSAPARANILAVGGQASREDQAAFMAGVLAGLTTRQFSVGVLADPEGALGREYRNGFTHGVRYACPECEITAWPLPPGLPAAEAETAAQRLFNRMVLDVAFAQPGPAGEAALHWLAQRQVWVIGAGETLNVETLKRWNVGGGAGRVLGSVSLRPDLILRDALGAVAEGRPPPGPLPYSLASGSITFEQTAADPLTPADHAFFERAVVLLATGELDTGVDPVTGEER